MTASRPLHDCAMRLLAASAFCAALALPAGAQQQPPPAAVSPAETLLFVGPHVGNLAPPASLRYRFVRSGSLEPALEDEVQIDFRDRAAGGCCSAQGRFLSGPRALSLPEIDDAQANPVILYFLENDVRDMQRRTGGQQAHFRRRIRLALAESASVRDTTFQHGGRAWPAKEVRVTPYVADPSRNRFERYASKEYVFVLAPGLPGTVAQMRTRIPGPGAADAPPLLEETVTLAEK